MKWKRLMGFGLVCGWLAGCATLQSPTFDQTALDQAIAAKARALAVVSSGAQPYTQNEAAIAALRAQVESAATYAVSRPHNEVVVKQWQVMNDPQANLLGGYLKRWQAEGHLNPAFVTEAGHVIGEGFDKIIETEQARKQ